MSNALSLPAFIAYAVTALVLCLILLALWAYSGVARAKSGVQINAEDSALFKAPLSETDPPAVARVLQAHRKAEAVIYSFLAVGLVFTLAGDGAWLAKTLFGVFAAARLAHSIAYLGGWQPWRTGFFVVSLLALAALMIATAALLV